MCFKYNIKLLIALIFTLSGGVLFSTQSQFVEIVVPAGSNLHDVQKQVRQLKNNMTSDIAVVLEGGTFFLTNTLKFTEEDSPTSGFRIIWKNKPNERPVISGGLEIKNWTDVGNDIVSAQVNDGFVFRQLYVNNTKSIRAKYLDKKGEWASVRYDKSNKRFYLPSVIADQKGITNWDQIDKVEINVVSTFVTHQPKLSSISSDYNAGITYLNISDPVASILSNRNGFGRSSDGTIIYDYDIYFENAFEFIDEPGEWYLDEITSKVYYKLRPGETSENIKVIAPAIENIFLIDGAKDITFYGLTFAHSTWLKPSFDGIATTQNLFYTTIYGSYPGLFPIPAAVHITNSNNIQFERNIFKHTGGTGLMAYDDKLVGLSLIGNVFYETAAAALQLGDDDKKGAKLPVTGLYQPLVSNNFFYRCGLQYGSPVVFGTFPYQLDFNHNELCYSYGMGLNLGWGALNVNDLLYRPLVYLNKFDSIALQGTDISVFHTRNFTKGSWIKENWFDHSTKVITKRILGRYNVSPNDPKFGNMYLDNDALDNNFIGNVHTNFTSNGYDGGRDGFYIFGDKAAPNYIIDYRPNENANVIANAGIKNDYKDIKNYIDSGSIGGSLNPSQKLFGAYLVDDRDSEVNYTGTWLTGTSGGVDLQPGGYLNTYTYTTEKTAKVSLTFNGKGIEVFGPIDQKEVLVDVYIDGVFDRNLSLKGRKQFQRVWYENHHLPAGNHTIEILKTGGSRFVIDGFVVYRDAEDRTDTNVFQVIENTELDLLIRSRSGFLTIDGSDLNKIKQVMLYDISGTTLFSRNINKSCVGSSIVVDLSMYSCGIYIVKVLLENNRIIRKLKIL